MFAPLVAEFEDRRVPMGFLIALGGVGLVASTMLRKKPAGGVITI